MNGLIPSTSVAPPPPYKIQSISLDTIQPSVGKDDYACHICGAKDVTKRDVGPYLIQMSEPQLVTICPCLHKAHLICLESYGVDHVCSLCNFVYPSSKNVYVARLICFACHALSVLSAVGLLFGLSQLGRALDELALGSEMGSKLDGDATWQEHEMEQITEWLNIVYYSTGFSGEAILGLVYIVGTCLIIGYKRTIHLISNIVHINLDLMFKADSMPNYMRLICISLRKRILDVKKYTKTDEIV
ncbi:hypothetical protein CU098_011033 [Rhizopus stolonifer]|uniref:Uncharacterized protein n=1 Tax=Rhizopus stolonifer TaxID=4846 RepID=A0A367KR53_RHIST|nr:hypothetical protein CU098_011033 [Rhizopus stolonifer]